jgi:hypothetical protein
MAREVDPDVIATVEDVRATTIHHAAGCGPGKMPLPWRGSIFRRLLGESQRGRMAYDGGRRAAAGALSDGTAIPEAA